MHFRYVIRFLCWVVVVLAPGSCINPPAAESRYNKLATAYCECTAQLAALNRQAATTRDSDLNTLLLQMQTEYDKARECATSIVAQFGHLKPAELDSLNRVLATQCPDLADNRDLLQELLGE